MLTDQEKITEILTIARNAIIKFSPAGLNTERAIGHVEDAQSRVNEAFDSPTKYATKKEVK